MGLVEDDDDDEWDFVVGWMVFEMMKLLLAIIADIVFILKLSF